MTSSTPRLFHLERDTDVTGVSGTGRVADGVQWPDGTVALRWIGDRPSTVLWGSVDDVAAIHGHGGATRIVWADEPPAPDRTTAALAAVRALCELTIRAGSRVQAIEQARDTLAVITHTMTAEQPPADEAPDPGQQIPLPGVDECPEECPCRYVCSAKGAQQ
ncbi:hypothetical protein ACWCV2_15360 [Streptomyces pseudogriseolus]